MFVLLFLIWMFLNGVWSFEVMVTGAAVSAALTWLSRRVLNLTPWGGVRLLGRLPKVLFYVLYLIKEVVCANIMVMRRILRPSTRRGPPKLVWFHSGLQEPGTQLLLANSITLTPGTVTLSLHNGQLCVYALDASFAEGLKECGFVVKLQDWEEDRRG